MCKALNGLLLSYIFNSAFALQNIQIAEVIRSKLTVFPLLEQTKWSFVDCIFNTFVLIYQLQEIMIWNVWTLFLFFCFSSPTSAGFRRKEFRGKLAIAITANFVNRNTTAEAKVEEISGVAFIFNQKFFLELKEDTGESGKNVAVGKWQLLPL